jgi:hypothetical protein
VRLHLTEVARDQAVARENQDSTRFEVDRIATAFAHTRPTHEPNRSANKASPRNIRLNLKFLGGLCAFAVNF